MASMQGVTSHWCSSKHESEHVTSNQNNASLLDVFRCSGADFFATVNIGLSGPSQPCASGLSRVLYVIDSEMSPRLPLRPNDDAGFLTIPPIYSPPLVLSGGLFERAIGAVLDRNQSYHQTLNLFRTHGDRAATLVKSDNVVAGSTLYTCIPMFQGKMSH